MYNNIMVYYFVVMIVSPVFWGFVIVLYALVDNSQFSPSLFAEQEVMS